MVDDQLLTSQSGVVKEYVKEICLRKLGPIKLSLSKYAILQVYINWLRDFKFGKE
jgi:hypothetical protein